MFPINWNDVFRKKDGTLGKMEDLGGGSSDIPSHTSADAGKVLTVGEDGELEWDDAGGAGGVYVGTTPPDSSLGSNGEYYYQRSDEVRWLKSINDAFTSTQQNYGNEIKINSECTIIGIAARLNATKTGSLVIGDDTSIIETIDNVSFTNGEWVEAMLTTPIHASQNDVIIVKFSLPTSGGIAYTQSTNPADFVVNTSVAEYVRGRYTSDYPGSSDNAKLPIGIITKNDYYTVTTQYYKVNGVWTII